MYFKIKLLMLISYLTLNLFATEPWSKTNLYDSKTDSYYIPYELWTGSNWNGEKVMTFHKADLNFMNGKTIKGPVEFYHKKLDETIQVYERINDSKIQLFTFYEDGIARVYDNRKERFFDGGFKFPAGFGWKINELKETTQTEWKKDKERTRDLGIKIIDLKFDSNHILESMTYEFYVKGELDHTYTYVPNKGMTKLLKNKKE